MSQEGNRNVIKRVDSEIVSELLITLKMPLERIKLMEK
jgi:hypothetical protein